MACSKTRSKKDCITHGMARSGGVRRGDVGNGRDRLGAVRFVKAWIWTGVLLPITRQSIMIT